MTLKPSPIIRLSIGLAAVTVCLLLTAEILGIIPDQSRAALEARQKICEALALQLSWDAINNNRRSIDQTLKTVVDKNPDILSAALLSKRTGTIAQVGDHELYWDPPEDGTSIPTSVQVPIFNERGQWGTLQLSFEPIRSGTGTLSWMQSTVGLLFFTGGLCFLLFWVFLKRALRELDPSRVIPEHVKAAFNALAEGVLIMDEDEQIVLANVAFSRLIGIDSDKLIGQCVAEFGWKSPQINADNEHAPVGTLPWQHALTSGEIKTGVPLLLPTISGEARTLMVNGAPIVDGDGSPRGALATFDDVSELQKNHAELQTTLMTLAKSKEEIKRQNQELQFLATRDPLTRCLNRRAMFQRFEDVFSEARLENLPLCCAMIDIDHFKSFNDHYGHAAGDKVIKFVAKVLRSSSRSNDIVARYGGEEFCVIMPGLSDEAAVAAAERLRTTIRDEFSERFTSSRDLTVSIGVTALRNHTDTMNEILNRADEALYAAKRTGRDCVVAWNEQIKEITATDGTISEVENEDSGESMLVQIIDDPTETLKVLSLSEKVMELDAIIEEKSGAIHRQHGFDTLTGLPKRILFYDRVLQSLSIAQREGSSVAVLYLDVAMQKRVGDELEPVMADQLMKETSERLVNLLRNNQELAPLLTQGDEHTVSRLGNNEFGIVLPDLVNTEAATWVIQRLFEGLDEPMQLNGNEIYVGCSIGISLYPSDGEDVETLMGRASQARHLAHAQSGRHKYLFYAEDMNVRSYQQVKLESQLRHALENDEFVLYYQPTYDLSSGRIVGLESLLRWNNPEMGLVGPGMFMHIAEQTGLIEPIGEWVLRQACNQAKEWLEAGMGDLNVAVNLSAVQLRLHNMKDVVVNILAETGLPAQHLELEVTETALMDNFMHADKVLQNLRQRGVTVAMDDFGTGYSSLSHLKQLTVDKLKIDRSFVRDVIDDHRDAAVVGSIIEMAKLMGLLVTAEGVENQAQFDFLKKRQCDMVQGYLLSRPVPAAKATALLQAQQAKQNRDAPDKSSAGKKIVEAIETD